MKHRNSNSCEVNTHAHIQRKMFIRFIVIEFLNHKRTMPKYYVRFDWFELYGKPINLVG